MAKFRIGVLGAGRIVERMHLPILSKMPNADVVGVFDPDTGRAAKLAHQFGIPHIAHKLEDLFHLSLDCLLVACPNAQHAEMSIAALEAGMHVICEKPMATTFDDAQKMVATAEITGRELVIAFNNRFRPDVLALQRVIQRGDIGKVVEIHCEWLRRSGIPGSWFMNHNQSGGGVLTDLGSHVINTALLLSGQQQLLTTCGVIDYTLPVEHHAAAWYLPDVPVPMQKYNVEISAKAAALFSSSFRLSVAVSWACDISADQTTLHVIGTQGIAVLNTLFGFSPNGVRPASPLTIYAHGEVTSPVIERADDISISYENQWKAFIEGLGQKHSLRSHLNESLLTVQIIEEIYRSAVIQSDPAL